MTTRTVTIQIENGEAYRVPVGDSLFQTLRNQRVFIPTLCGGKGFCGKCKIRVLAGAPATLNEKELRQLSAEEQADGWRLSCQLRVERDMRVELPENIRDVRMFTAEVTALEMVSATIRRVGLRLITPPAIHFLPGAFILIDIPPSPGAPRGASRAYSIASPPSATGAFDINVKRVPSGIGSGYVHNTLARGDELTFTGPYSGYADSADEHPLICVAGGSGMSPVLSILRHLKETGSKRKVHYFFGTRSHTDLLYMDELRTLERDLPDFTFIPVVECREPEDEHLYECGLVTDALKRHVTDAGDSSAYLCGGPAMLDACCEVLTGRGLNRDRVFFDPFS